MSLFTCKVLAVVKERTKKREQKGRMPNYFVAFIVNEYGASFIGISDKRRNVENAKCRNYRTPTLINAVFEFERTTVERMENFAGKQTQRRCSCAQKF